MAVANALNTLLEYFPTGTAEGEREILRRAFVEVDDFTLIVTPPAGSPRLLVGKKGSGKSAIIDFSLKILEKAKVPALMLRPMQLRFGELSSGSSVGDYTNAAYSTLVTAIASSLGATFVGLLNADEKICHDQALANGYKEPDALERFAEILPRIAKPYLPFDFSELLPKAETSTLKRIEDALSRNIARSDTGFFLFIDDIDQVAAPDKPGHLNRIWAVLLAARALTERVRQLRVVISLREEVWRRLLRDKAGQRDQADHFVTLVRHLNPSTSHIAAIIARRLLLAAEDAVLSFARTPYECFFEDEFPRIPTADDERRSWEDLISLRSRERPRDAVQLINALACRAIDDARTKITDRDFAIEMKQFSTQRVEFLAQEVEIECPEIREIVSSFSKISFDRGSFKASAEVIRNHLERLPSSTGITLFGRRSQPDNFSQALDLWRLLFDVGILNARIPDAREKDGYRHVQPREDKSLVSEARWNDVQAITWEINPAYRDHLIKEQQDLAARLGLTRPILPGRD